MPLNLRALLAPVFIAIVTSIVAFAMLVIFTANEQDTLSVSSQRTVLRQHLTGVGRNLEVLAVDNAWWDTAVEKIVVNVDLQWIEDTLGDTVEDIDYLDGVLIVRQDQSIIYSFQAPQKSGPMFPVDALLASPLGHALQQLSITQYLQNSSGSGTLEVDGHLISYGVGLVHTDDEAKFADHSNHTFPALIFYSLLTPEEVLKMGNGLSIENLRFTGEEPTVPGSLQITDARGEPFGWMVWHSRTPGTEMVKKMLLPAVLLLILIAATMTHFVKRATLLFKGLEQASQSKTAFIASMSHEVRTPLNSILGFSEMMALEIFGKIEGAKNKEYLKLIQHSGKHLLTIINDILDISKLEAGKFNIYAEEILPRKIIEESVRMVDPGAHDRGVSLTHHCGNDKIFCDERIMRQILINILSNAVKYTDKDGAVHISGELKDAVFQVRVTDNGIGMSQTEIETALATFGQVHNDLAKHHSGTGLGLPLVTRFMQLLGGTMHISSNPGKGTSVTLNFPVTVEVAKG